MGFSGSFAIFKKEVKKFIIENDVALSCLWCLIDIIHWMYYCNLLYSEAIVRKCSPEIRDASQFRVVTGSSIDLAPDRRQVNARANVCLLTNERRTKRETSTYSWYKERYCKCHLYMYSGFNVFTSCHVHWSQYNGGSLGWMRVLGFTADQLMWSTIVHHIPTWREPSPLRDVMRRLWTCTLWNVDCLHANWLIRCIWIAVSAAFIENNAHPVCIVNDKIPLGCGGRQTRVTVTHDVVDDNLGCGRRHLSVNISNHIKRVLICGRWISHGQLFTSEPWEISAN